MTLHRSYDIIVIGKTKSEERGDIVGLQLSTYTTKVLEEPEDVIKDFAWYLNKQVGEDMYVFTREEMLGYYQEFRGKNTLRDEDAEDLSNWIGDLSWEDDTVGLIFDY